MEITSAELQKNFGKYRMIAMREPVLVTNHGREDLAVISAEEYRRLQQFEPRAFYAHELSNEEIAALDHVEFSDECAQYDHEVED